MNVILGKFKGQNIRVPEFHKNGKRNEKFDHYENFVNKDETAILNYIKGEKIGERIAEYSKTRLRIKVI